MIVFIDTETTGLPDFNKRARDPEQPHIVQLAAILCEDNGEILETFEAISKPDGWEIPEDATKVHGITNEKANEIGVPEKDICAKVLELIRKAGKISAYNAAFDKFIVRIGLRRFDLMTDADDEWWKALPSQCTMRPMVNVCQLEPKVRGRWKFPKLTEAYEKAFGVPAEGKAHTAMADVLAARELYIWQTQQNLIQ